MPYRRDVCIRCLRFADVVTVEGDKHLIYSSCPHCGDFYEISRIREHTDIVLDYGKYKFVSSSDPVGSVEIKTKFNRNIVCVDKAGFDTFIDYLRKNINNFDSVVLSRLDGRYIERIDLLNLLR